MPLPEPWTHIHRHWVLNDPPEDDAHGNPKGHFEAPVTRKHIVVRQLDTQEPATSGTVNQVITDLTMAVRDPAPYSTQDEVTIDGLRYRVTGTPFSYLNGMFPAYNAMLGAEIRLRRVT
jgi:hypothetical protein